MVLQSKQFEIMYYTVSVKDTWHTTLFILLDAVTV